MAERAGLPAVLDDAIKDQVAPGDDQARQPQLFALEPTPDGDGAGELGRRGRPPGSRNRRTEDWAAWITGRYGHPLDRLGQLYSADPIAMARSLGIKVSDAVARQIEAAKAALPYVASPMPQKVQVSGKGALIMGIAPGGNVPGGDHLVGVDAMTALDAFLSGKIEQLQRVSDAVDLAGNATDGNVSGESDDGTTG
jgi:hypothetical protein